MIKKLCSLAAILAVTAGSVAAQTPLQMVFKTSDGNVSAIEAKSLSMSVSGDKLIAANGDQSLEFELNKLVMMYFSDESGVTFATVDMTDTPVEIYTIDGKVAGKFESTTSAMEQLPAGVYVVKTSNNKTFKISIQ